MKRAAKLWWLGFGAVSSCVALACDGNNATVVAMNDAGTAGAAGTIDAAGSGGVADSTWIDVSCGSFDCAQSGCPAARSSNGAGCVTTPTFAKDPMSGTCCPYASSCDAPDTWPRFASASACMGIDSGGCPAGFSDCNLDKQDGCETRTPVGTTCVNACTASPNAPDGGSASSSACPSEPCPAGTVCVVEVGGVAGGGGARCEPIPTSCDGQPSCACMKFCSCVNGVGSRPESCSEQSGAIYCDNGIR